MADRVFRKGHAADWRRTMVRMLALMLLTSPGLSAAAEAATNTPPPPIRAFGPGERLSYRISWSRIFTAGVAVLKVEQDTLPDGRDVLVFNATARSVGLVDALYGLKETVESVFDPRIMESLYFSLHEVHGSKTRSRSLIFDHDRRVVVSRLNQDQPKTEPVPDPVQDALSSLYVLRTEKGFTAGGTHVIEVHDSGKNWSVQFQTLGRERVRTKAGEFSTIKIRTHPRYKGVFMNKGEILLWLTDDEHKVPVLMKSKIAVGSVVLSLTDMKRPSDGGNR